MFSKRGIADFLNRRLRGSDIFITRLSDLWHPSLQLGKQPFPTGAPQLPRPPLLRRFGSENGVASFDFAVVMSTILRPSIADALRSIFAQDFAGTVQTLVGVDVPRGDISLVEKVCEKCPAHHTVLLFDPGYSTSTRHGGLHPSWDGGVLRTMLSYLAGSRRVAYLDDDNWWAPNHLTTLCAALEGHEWAWSMRWYVHRTSRRIICKDAWESVGPNAGTQPGGWVDTNCLAIDKLACEAVLRWWSIPLHNSTTATDADKRVFHILKNQFRGRGTSQYTTYYALNEADADNDKRIERIGVDRYRAAADPITSQARSAGDGNSGSWSRSGLGQIHTDPEYDISRISKD